MTKHAYLLKTLISTNTEKKALYKLDPPLSDCKFVVVSAIKHDEMNKLFDKTFGEEESDQETYIFASSKNGKIIDWNELMGSAKYIFSHKTVLKNAGYQIVKYEEN